MRDTLGRSWKVMVAIAVVLGGIGFFTPFLAAPAGETTVGVSPYRVLIGFDDVTQIAPELNKLDPDGQRQFLARWNQTVRNEVRVAWDRQYEVPSRIPYYFLGVLACALAAAIAFASRGLGLFTSLLVLAGGLWTMWGWTRELVMDRHAVERAVTHVAWGASFLVACSVLAVVAGIGSFVVPDPGKRRRTVRVVIDGEAREVAVDEPTTSVPSARLRRR